MEPISSFYAKKLRRCNRLNFTRATIALLTSQAPLCFNYKILMDKQFVILYLKYWINPIKIT
jgi:hypothetical protein